MQNHAVLLATLFTVHVLAMASPGPNFLVVTQAAISRTRRAGIATALGVAAAATLWAIAALLGLTVLFTHLPWLQTAVKLLGGGYLIYLALRLWRSAERPLRPASPTAPHKHHHDGQAFLLGFFTNLTNPKAIVYYASIFAAFVSPQLPAWVRLAAIGIIVVAATAWHVGLACLFSTPRAQRTYGRVKRWIDRAAGAAFALLGVQLILDAFITSRAS